MLRDAGFGSRVWEQLRALITAGLLSRQQNARTQASGEFAQRVGPVVAELRQAGMSFRQIVAELQKRDIRTMRGGQWTAMTVRNVLLRSGA